MTASGVPPPDALVCFAHGKESGPWGTKITHLAQTARRRGFEVISPDYSHTHDPHLRVKQLLELRPVAGRALVLVGSSMGGYVSAMACAELQPQALFLMAPAFYFPGFDEEPSGIPALCEVVHGWRDDIVPPERAIRFAGTHRAGLHLIDSDHSLNDRLDVLDRLLDALLAKVLERGAAPQASALPPHRSYVPTPESKVPAPRAPLTTRRRQLLEDTYRRAEYRVRLDSGDLLLHVDRFDAQADSLLRDSGVMRSWAIVTPCNPHSEQTPSTVNAGYQRDLREVLEHNRIVWRGTTNRDPDGQWPDEPGFLLCDPEPGMAEALGRRFHQNAIVQGTLGTAPLLVWLDR